MDPAPDQVDYILAYAEGYFPSTYSPFSEPKLLCTSELQTLNFSLRSLPYAP
jgi:hypothetical protein